MPETVNYSSPCYCTNLRKTARAISGLYDTALAPSGLRATQFALLRHVRRLEPVTMNTLSRHMQLERTTLVRNLTLLKKQDLIAAETPSGRAENLRITEKGKALLDRATPLWEDVQKNVEAVLSPDEKATLKQLLAKLGALGSSV